MGLALPDCGKLTLWRRNSLRTRPGGGVGAVGGTVGKYVARPPTGGVGSAGCEVTGSAPTGRLLGDKKGEACASMVPVGRFRTLKLCARWRVGDLGMCLAGGRPGGWNGRAGMGSPCVDPTLVGRLMEGRLCGGWVSIGEGVMSCCEPLRLRLRCCSASASCGFKIEWTGRGLPALLSFSGVGGVRDSWRSGGSETGGFPAASWRCMPARGWMGDI